MKIFIFILQGTINGEYEQENGGRTEVRRRFRHWFEPEPTRTEEILENPCFSQACTPMT